jgi:hypothetical protein
MSNRKKQLFAFLIVISVVINLSIVTSANSPTPDDYSSSAVQYELKTMDGQEITTEEDIIVDLGDERLRSEKNDKKHESDIDIRKQVSLQVKESKSFLINDKIKEPDSNEEKESLSIKSSLPDISVYDLQRAAGQPNPFIGMQDSNVEVTVVNIGTAATGGFHVGIECDGYYFGGFYVSNMAPLTGTIFTITLSQFPAGSYEIKVIGDYYNSVTESNEDNNTEAKTFVWSGKPDLRADMINTFGSYPYYTDSDIGVRFKVTNVGNANINQNCRIEIRLDGEPVVSYTVSYWPIGTYMEEEFYIKFLNAGTYELQVLADPYNYIDEHIETNNSKSTNVTIHVAPQVTVSGTVIGYIRPNNSQPAQATPMSNFPVKIMHSNLLSGETLGTGYTDSNGNFSITVNHKSGGTNLYVKLEFQDDIINITSHGLFGTTHIWETDRYMNCQLKSLNVGNIPQNANETINGSFSIWKWIKQGHEYYSSASFNSIPKVKVLWESGVKAGTNANSSRISIDGENLGYSPYCYDGDVILHEYGHFIMGNLIGFPGNILQKHHWDVASNLETAYCEGWAHFFSCAARNSSQSLDWATNGNSFGGNLNNATTLLNGTATPLPLYNDYERNAKYELNVGAVMWDLFTGNQTIANHPFSDLDNTMASYRSNSVYDFYDKWFQTVNSQYTNKQIWNAFENRRCSYDITVPVVSITATGNTVFALATDDIGIERHEWYVDGNLVSQGTAASSSLTLGSNYSPGLHIIWFNAYDPEGMLPYTTINPPDRPRSDRYGTNSIAVYKQDSKSSDISSNLTNKDDILKANPGNINERHAKLVENIGKSEKTIYKRIDLLTADDVVKNIISVSANEDVKIYCDYSGAIKEINIYNSEGELLVTEKNIYKDKPLVINNSVDGELEIEVVSLTSGELKKMGANPKNISLTSTPYSLIITTVPSKVELDLPAYTNDPLLLEKLLGEKTDDNIMMQVDGVFRNSYRLEEGINKVTFSRKIGDYVSDTKSYEVILDTLAPEIKLEQSVPKETDMNHVLINGCCSDDTNTLYINDQYVMLGEWSSRSFAEGFMLIKGENRFVLRAIDRAGNITEKELIITRR